MAKRAVADILFSGKHIRLLDMRIAGDRDILVISFPVRAAKPSFQSSGFAERWLAKVGISAIEVKVSSNHWFQTSETDEAMAVISEIAGAFRRVVTYGSSMGGYGAIACSRAIGAHTAVAVSPQWTVDPEKLPWEKRWADDAAQIQKAFGFGRDHLPELVATEAEICVVADPWDKDAEHARRILDEVPGASWLLAHGCGHSAAGGLVAYKMLGSFAISTIRGGGDIRRWRAPMRDARRTSARYWAALSWRAIARGERGFATARTAALRSVEIEPHSELRIRRAAQIFVTSGDSITAATLLDRCRNLENVTLPTTVMYADLLSRVGRKADAEVQLERLRELAPDHPKIAAIEKRLRRGS